MCGGKVHHDAINRLLTLAREYLMAWIISQQPLPRWTVGTRTVPEAKALHQERLAYRFEDPAGRTPYKGSILQQGLKVPERLFPREAHVMSSTRNPPDLLTIAGWGMSERLKGLIERLEPDVHQFVPVQTFLRDGTPTPQRYYAVVLGRVATNQIDDELTTMQRNPEGRIEVPMPDGILGAVVINRNETLGWHAWFSRDIFNSFTISDELNALLKAENVQGLQRVHLAEREQLKAS